MKKAVIYARYSSEKQNEQSIEGQLSVCYKYAQNKDISIVGEYIDRATTGTNDNRANFQQMLTDSAKREWDFVIVYKGDRFARNRIESAINKKKLKDNNVKVLSATENIPDTPEGIILESLLEGMAEYYSAELSQKVQRGMRELVKKKQTLGGVAPFGYKIVDKKLVVNEEESCIVKYYFEEYAKGTSKKDIVDYLNSHNYRNRQGKKFTLQSFGELMKNKKYMGVLDYKGELVEDYCPAIVSKEVFNQVQDRMALNKHYAGKRKAFEKFILTGKLFCGYCGDTIVGISGTSQTGDRHSYYVCSSRYKKHTCHKKNMAKSVIEKDIIDLTIKRVKTNIKVLSDNLYILLQDITKETNIEEYENKIKDIDKELDNIFELFTKAKQPELIDRLNKKVEDLSETKLTYQKELQKMKIFAKSQITKKEISEYVKEYVNLGKSERIEDKEKFVNAFINRVYITDDKYLIYINNDDNSDEDIDFDTFNEDVSNILQNSGLTQSSYSERDGQPSGTQLNHPYKCGHQLSFLILLSTELVSLI